MQEFGFLKVFRTDKSGAKREVFATPEFKKSVETGELKPVEPKLFQRLRGRLGGKEKGLRNLPVVLGGVILLGRAYASEEYARKELEYISKARDAGVQVDEPVVVDFNARNPRIYFRVNEEIIADIHELLASQSHTDEFKLKAIRNAVSQIQRLHAAGCVHGDLHMGQVLVDRKGGVMIVDSMQERRNFKPSASTDDAMFHAAVVRGMKNIAINNRRAITPELAEAIKRELPVPKEKLPKTLVDYMGLSEFGWETE